MDSLLALVLATAILVAVPGPNVALIVALSLKSGPRAGLLTVCGTTAGLALQLAIVVAGLAAFIELAASALSWIRWLGVIYIILLGIYTWSSAPRAAASPAGEATSVSFWRGLLFAVVNPKTLIFNAAFLPQFLGSTDAAAAQLPLLAAVYLTVVLIGDCCWALFASAARRWLRRFGHWHNRLTGGVLIGAGAGLALSDR
ncbi:MAG: LysE family translocator [Gammaproteobacteria bacterium]|nr:LysE family translocator [Gammaproteobacteria bacterium]